GQSPAPDECRQHRLSRGAETSPSRGRSSGARLLAQPPDEKRPLLLVETAPDPVALAGLQGVGQALPAHRASVADALGFRLVRLVDGEEDLEVGVRAGGMLEVALRDVG